MGRPAIEKMLKNNESYYSLVVAVAKRAREIALDAENEGIILTEKTVMLAESDFVDGKYKFQERDGIGKVIE